MSQIESSPKACVTADALTSILANRRVRDKPGYVAGWMRNRDIVREDIAAVHAMLAPLADALRLEIVAYHGRPNAHIRRRMSHCARLLYVLSTTATWLGSAGKKTLDDSAEAVELAREAGDHALESANLVCQGNLLNKLGRHGEAMEVFQQALALNRRHGTPNETIYALLSIAGLLHFRLNDSGGH